MNKEFPQHWVFVRGLTRGAFHWLGFEKQFKDFFKLNQVDCPELSGNGTLNDEISPTHIDAAVEQLRSQVELHGKKIGLFSISMGGMIATRWALMYPDEVSHLILVNSSFSSLSPFYHRLKPQNYPKIADNFLIYDAIKLEKFILGVTSNNPEKWTLRLDEVVGFQQKHPVSLGNFMRQLKMSKTADCKTAPAAETLVLASKNDRLVSVKCSEAIVKKWNCHSEFHPTAGHDLPLDDPNWILDSVKKNFKY